MKNKYLFSLLLALAFSCSDSSKTNREKEETELSDAPMTYPLGAQGNYTLNIVSGDSIKPIISSSGDTIQTGVVFPVQGKLIRLDSIEKPEVVVVKSPAIFPAHGNIKQVPDALSVTSVDELKLKRYNSKNPTSDFILTNSVGDTIQTGIPIPVTGKSVPCVRHKPQQAFPFRMKDNAILDIQHLDIDQGLASSYIRSILQDKSGNIWFGTAGSGVSRYDGHSFTNFKEDDGLPHNIIWTMMEDRNGNIWFGTYGGGVCKYDGHTFTHFTENEGLANNFVVAIVEDKSGNIWFGSDGSGVTKYDGKTLTHYTEAEGLCNNYVYAIAEDKSGDFWFGTKGGGMCKLLVSEGNQTDELSFVHFGINEGLISPYVMALEVDREDNIWLSIYGEGVLKYDGKTFTHYSVKEGLSNNNIWTIDEDREGNIWFGSNGGGLSKFNGSSFLHLTETEGLSNNYILSVIEDDAGNFWVGTNGGGVCKYNDRSFVHTTQDQGLSNNRVRSICEDNKGNIWFGTYGGGVVKYDGNLYYHFQEIHGLVGPSVMAIQQDRYGNIWFGTNGYGISKYTPATLDNTGVGTFTQYTSKNGLTSDFIKVITEDQEGDIWIGTNDGINRFSGAGGTLESVTHYTEKEGLPNKFIVSIIEDESGNIWFGTNGGGIGKIDCGDGKNGEESLLIYTEHEGISNNAILSMLEDSRGNIWIGTNGGGITKLLLEDANKGETMLTYYDEKGGLANNVVWSLIEDKEGQIYASTENGISLLTADTGALQIFNFRKADGLKGIDFYANSVLLDTKNRMWWGSGQCLTMLDMDRFELSKKNTNAFLRDVEINENYFDYRTLPDSLKNGMSYDSIAAYENYPLGLILPFDQNHVTFYFATIDWSAQYKIKYQYKLEGLDNEWNPVTEKNFADYRNIPYGKFTFKVRAMGESQIWGEPVEYSFTILPPWWHTWWFRILLATAFVLMLYFVYRWRTASLRARQKRLEKIVKERTAEVVLEKNEAQKQRELVEEKHKEITDSINYAERIQRSFLATKDLLDENLKDYFVFFQPKDVVSGDFFWASKLENGNFALVTADSTGHGVPGAIMSILNISSLEKAVEIGLTNPAEIFNHTRQTIISRLKKDGSKEGGKDGMDASLICFDFANKKISYAAANNPVWVVRPSIGSNRAELIELNPDKMPVGKHDNDQIPFLQSDFDLQPGDVIYTLTDGFPDQFGGEKGKKFMYKRLKELLISIASDSMEMQKEKLTQTFLEWKGELEQVDDVCIIGIRL